MTVAVMTVAQVQYQPSEAATCRVPVLRKAQPKSSAVQTSTDFIEYLLASLLAASTSLEARFTYSMSNPGYISLVSS